VAHRALAHRALARAGLAGTAACVLLLLAGGPALAATTPPSPPAQSQPAQNQPTQSPPAQTQSTPASTGPQAPSGLSVTPGDGRVALSWNTAEGATSYAVFAATVTSFTASVRVLLVSGAGGTVTGLADGTTYYFWVIAADSAGHSDAAGPVQATPVAPVTVPGAPGDVRANSRDGGVTVTWAAPASDGGSGVTGYDVFAATSANFRDGLEVRGVTGTRWALGRQQRGHTWYFKVAAVNARGAGPASAVVSALAGPATTVHPTPPESPTPAETPTPPATPTPAAPGPPTSVSAEAGQGEVILWWTAPATSGTPVSGYLVFIGTRPGGESATPVNTVPVHGTSVALAGLVAGTRYYFTVAAAGANGRWGGHSAEVTSVPLDPPGPRRETGVTAGQTPVTGSGQPPGTPAGIIQVAAAGAGADPGTGESASPGATVTTSPPHAAAIIALSGVAAAALAGAVGAALHLRRRQRLATPPAASADREPVDHTGGWR
jgi:Fibronectin type III domain